MSDLVKVFSIKLKPGTQAEAEAIVREFTPKGPAQEVGTRSFRVYRGNEGSDYLLFVEHFTDADAYAVHTSSHSYSELVAGKFRDLVDGWSEVDHELIVSACQRTPVSTPPSLEPQQHPRVTR
jgi:quinol monooxygenase YgiN